MERVIIRALALGAACVGVTVPAWAGGLTELVSVNSRGEQGNSFSAGLRTGISDDSRFVAFASIASNLVTGDTNNSSDVFVRDRVLHRTSRVSISSSGDQGQPGSGTDNVFMSSDGRFVAFDFGGANLVPGDTNNRVDIFVHDRETRTTERVNLRFDRTQTESHSFISGLSADGRYVLFATDDSRIVPQDTNGTFDVFVHDRKTHTTERLSVGSNGVESPGPDINGSSISPTGRFVTFATTAKLVADDTNGESDVYVHDRKTNTTERVSVGSNDREAHGYSQGGAISAEGRFVVFESMATDLVANDTNDSFDLFVHDRKAHITRRVNVSSDGAESHGFPSNELISADGRLVTFYSDAPDLVTGDTNGVTDVFVHHLDRGATVRISGGRGSAQANGVSQVSSISTNGRYVTFISDATNLTRRDRNEATDVFVTMLDGDTWEFLQRRTLLSSP